MPERRVAVSATFTAELLREPLQFLFKLLRWDAEVVFAPFAQVFQTLLDPAGLFAGNRGGVNVVLARADDFVTAEAAEHLVSAIGSAAQHQQADLFVLMCPSSGATPSPDLRILRAAERVTVLSAEEQDGMYPVAVVHDPRTLELGEIPYTDEFFASLAAYLARAMHRLWAQPYKAIALDCDDTLWRGICGEDGPAGVTLDAPRHALQQFMVAQQKQGRLLAIASKNNEEDVLETFRLHPEMPLRLEHFAARQMNWEGKAQSLQAIADELNVGLESFVFVDDNPKESAEVAAELPEVAALSLPPDAAAIPGFLEHVWAFDAPQAITAEDRNRTAAYAQQAERTSWERQARNLADFVAGLELSVVIRAIAEEDLPRAAQLTQRTNQMNVSTRRRSEVEIRAFLKTGLGYVVSVSDRFGDYGTVGLLLLKPEAADLALDTFLLSCRALGRGVEHQMLRFAGELASDRGFQNVIPRFEASSRNRPALEFLQSIASFAAADLSKLVYEPAKTVPETGPRVRETEISRPRTSPDYQQIAQLRRPLDLVTAVRNNNSSSGAFQGTSDPPRTELEQRLCRIWSELLGISTVGIEDNFFDLGGHSLLAVQLIARLQRDLGMELPLETVYRGNLTVADLARSIERFETGGLNEAEYLSLLAEIENLTDEEAEALLARELNPEQQR